MKCPLCKQELGEHEKLTFSLEEEDDNKLHLYVYHEKNGHWCWCCGTVV